MHVHIGGDDAGHPVKITASRSLTFANIAEEAVSRKGLDMVGTVSYTHLDVYKRQNH